MEKSLIYYLWDRIKLTDKKGHVVIGDVFSHSFEDDMEQPVESIDIDTGEKGYYLSFSEDEIDSIEVIEHSEVDPFGTRKDTYVLEPTWGEGE